MLFEVEDLGKEMKLKRHQKSNFKFSELLDKTHTIESEMLQRHGTEHLNLDIANIDIESRVKSQEKGKEARMTEALNNLKGSSNIKKAGLVIDMDLDIQY